MTTPRVCVVTGAAGGLGRDLVSYLAERGYKLAAIGRSGDAERLEALARDGSILPVIADVASATDWAEAIATIERKLGPPSSAVLVAGGWRGGEPLHEEPDDVYAALMAMNVDTARTSLAALLRGMVERKGGSIVLFGSRAAERPWESVNAASYAASKAAVVALAQVAAAEVIEHGVRVNAVLPSTIDTPQNRASMPKADFSRWVSTASLSAVVEFLLSDASKDVSGAVLPVYGRA